MTADPNQPVPKTIVILTVILGITLSIAVIAAARITLDREANRPVAMGAYPEYEAACADIIPALPDTAGAYHKVGVVEPRPQGAEAYRDNQGRTLTVRCGVRVPDQYTAASRIDTRGEQRWLHVRDETPGSDLSTWYSVGPGPTTALTTSAPLDAALDPIGAVIASGSGSSSKPKPYPTSTLRAGNSTNCTALLDALPASLGAWTRSDNPPAAPRRSATYHADGREPIVIRCGVAMPKAYRAGARLTQINTVPWFPQPGLSRGATTGLWFALGREAIVAVSSPQSAGNTALTAVTTAIEVQLSTARS